MYGSGNLMLVKELVIKLWGKSINLITNQRKLMIQCFLINNSFKPLFL